MRAQLYDILSDLTDTKSQLEALFFIIKLAEDFFESSNQFDAACCIHVIKTMLKEIQSNHDSSLESIDKLIINSN